MKHLFNLIFLFLTLISCESEKKDKIITDKPKSKQIVVISKYAPQSYKHYTIQDSVSKEAVDTLGSYSPMPSPIFYYFDTQNNINRWRPKTNEIDTLVIPYYKDYLELSIQNRYTLQPNTYLIKNGDTVIFDYKNKLPIAIIKNRQVEDIALNYNNYRLKNLFDNKYTSHHQVFFGILSSDVEESNAAYDALTISNYQKAIDDKARELALLDTLHQKKLLSTVDYKYRIANLNSLIEQHKNNRLIREWIAKNKLSVDKENIELIYNLDLTKADSLMTFGYFRAYVSDISKYDLPIIQANYGSSGGFYIDSRIRFDSIVKDKRFSQTVKNFLLFDAYFFIHQNFKVKDKKKYFKKLQEHTTDRTRLNQLAEKFNLDFSKSDKLIVTNLNNDTTTFSTVLKNNKGKWLYIDFWSSWCKPCRETMPASNRLQKELQKENIEFIFLGLNDKKDPWKKAIKAEGISKSQHYFIENGNVSTVIEDLGIKTIPHYLIYNPKGELVHGFADRPGKGAKEQLKRLLRIEAFK